MHKPHRPKGLWGQGCPWPRPSTTICCYLFKLFIDFQDGRSYAPPMLNVNYEMIVVLEVFAKIFFAFVPITAILTVLTWTIVKIID